MMDDPLGAPRFFRRTRSVKEHLEHHGRMTAGFISSIYPHRQVRRADGTTYLSGGDAEIRFGGQGRYFKVASKFPVELSLLLRAGQRVSVRYCPYFPAKLYVIGWPRPAAR